MTTRKEMKLGLALGGGGARGLAHLGVLQVLDREGFSPDYIVGTSIGSIAGAAYALHPDGLEITRRILAYLRGSSFKNNPFKKVLFHSEDVEQNFFRSVLMSVKKSYVFSSLIRKPSIFPGNRLKRVIDELIPDVRFEDTQIPFAVPAIDIRSGEEVILNEGSIRTAILASCSLPGYFPPVEHDGMLLMDAGVISTVPVEACLQVSPKVVVAVDISNQLQVVQSVDIGLDAILRVEAIAGRRIKDIELEKADVVIRPQVGVKDWSDFTGLDSLIESGVSAARTRLARIRELLAVRPRRRFWPLPSSTA